MWGLHGGMCAGLDPRLLATRPQVAVPLVVSYLELAAVA